MHYFTVEEANQAIIQIQQHLEALFESRDKILANRPENWQLVSKAAGNGGNRSLGLIEKEFDKVDKLVHLIQADGVVLKDIDMGLVDFPSLRDGREIYLCWRYGETQVSFWHEIDSGFSGRQPI
jgi:hypothetical protein